MRHLGEIWNCVYFLDYLYINKPSVSFSNKFLVIVLTSRINFASFSHRINQFLWSLKKIYSKIVTIKK